MCPFQALRNRSPDGAFALITGAQILAYSLSFLLPKVLEPSHRVRELLPAVLYLALCTAPAWVGFRSREDGARALRRSCALLLSNAALSLLMVLYGLDVMLFTTPFLRVSGWVGSAALHDTLHSCG